MRTWISEGRVGSDSLVWREGWPDWQQAGAVFPQLGSGGSPGANLAPMGTNGGAPTDAQAIESLPAAPGRSAALNAAIVVVLVLAVVVLLAVFVWVLKRGPEPSDEASRRGRATVASVIDGPADVLCWPPEIGQRGV
jgi:hypothetical protein